MQKLFYCSEIAETFRFLHFRLCYIAGESKHYLMMHAAQILVNVLREAWGAIIGLMVAVAILAMLAQIMKLTGGSVMGASLYVHEAIGSIVGLTFVVLYAFLAVPAIVHAISASAAGGGGCGPSAELGSAAAYVMAAVAAVRMAKAAFVSLISSIGGSSGGMSYAITEASEAMLGMLLISVAAPMAAALVGAC